MNNSDPLFSFKIQGQTTGNVAIATTTISVNSDGTWNFTDAAGDKVVYNGDSGVINRLLQIIFTGTGGFAAGQVPGIMY